MSLPIKILLVGTGVKGASRLREYLIERECQIEYAKSLDHGLALLERESFDLVLGAIDGESGKRARLIASLLNSSADLFFSLTVEDGCWWLPVVRNGEHCLGKAAVRSRDFLPALDKLLWERQYAQQRQHSEMAST